MIIEENMNDYASFDVHISLKLLFTHIVLFPGQQTLFYCPKNLQNHLVNGNFVEQKEKIRKSVLLIHIHRFDSIKVNPL